MTIRQRRLEKGWSQQQLAEFAGVSLRTIQRIEKGNSPTIETLKSLAAVFEVDFNELLEHDASSEIDESSLSLEEKEELRHIRKVQRFLKDVAYFLVSIPFLWVISRFGDIDWVWSVVFIWGAILLWDAYEVFDARDFFGKGWEKRMLEKRLGRKID